MKAYKLKENLTGLLDGLLSLNLKVVAPKMVKGCLLFEPVKGSDEVLLPEKYVNSTRSAKEEMFPRTEAVLKYRYNKNEVEITDPVQETEEKVIFGLRPCDAAAFPVIDKVFSHQYRDEFYLTRRANTTIIGFACESSDEACFCTSMNLGPDSPDGSDLFFKKDSGGDYYGLAFSEKGEELASRLPGIFELLDSEPEPSGKYQALKLQIREPLDLERIKSWLDGNFESDFWEQYSSQCLGCASCAFLCPTCHCFDIIDQAGYAEGLRRKNWDACQLKTFTVHASGHNPRDNQAKRYRQRVMHKFKYYQDRFGSPLCTGCGRCVRSCPVNLDIYAVVKEISNIAAEKS